MSGISSAGAAQQSWDSHVRANQADLELSHVRTVLTDIEGRVLVDSTIHERAEQQENQADGSIEPVRYALGSVSKLFTTVCALNLVGDGALELDVPVANYLLDLQIHPTRQAITLRQLLSHTSGLPNSTGAAQDTDIELFDVLAGADIDHTHQWRYSGLGFRLVGRLIEQVTGVSFATVLHERVAGPLRMPNTTVGPDLALADTVLPGRVPHVTWRPHRPGLDPLVLSPPFFGQGADAGVVSTAADLMQFANALLRATAGRPDALGLDDHLAALLTQPVFDRAPAGRVNFGLGTQFLPTRFGALIGHGGNIGGRGCLVFVSSDLELAAVLLGDSSSFDRIGLEYLFRLGAAARAGVELPGAPRPVRSTAIHAAERYQGSYHGPGELILHARGDGLLAQLGDNVGSVTRRHTGEFLIDLPQTRRYLTRFEPDLQTLWCGPTRYTRGRPSADTQTVEHPLAGIYRSASLTLSQLTVYRRCGEDYLVPPSGYEWRLRWLSDTEAALTEEDVDSPDIVRFMRHGESAELHYGMDRYYRVAPV